MARDAILENALNVRLAVKKVAHEANISTAAVSQWTRVPRKHLAAFERATGVPPHQARPDLYDASQQVAA